jgi:hypothetical protein
LPLRSFFSWSFPYCFFFSVSCCVSALPMNCAATWNLFFSSLYRYFYCLATTAESVSRPHNCSGSVTRNGYLFRFPPLFLLLLLPPAPELLYNTDSFSASIWPIRISLFRISSPRPNLCMN